MKNIAYTITTLVLSISTAVAAPSFSRRQDICGLASSVQVTAYGAAGADSSFSVLFDNLWHDIGGSKFSPWVSSPWSWSQLLSWLQQNVEHLFGHLARLSNRELRISRRSRQPCPEWRDSWRFRGDICCSSPTTLGYGSVLMWELRYLETLKSKLLPGYL